MKYSITGGLGGKVANNLNLNDKNNATSKNTGGSEVVEQKFAVLISKARSETNGGRDHFSKHSSIYLVVSS